MSKTKELIICIISIIALVLAVTTTVFATESQNLESLLGNTNSSVEEIPEITNNAANNVSNNITNNVANNVANNANNTTSIPYTGVDYSVIVIIAICGVSAIYAYKKIRDYNV